MNKDVATASVFRALDDGQSRFPAMASPHEGYAVCLEELDELWKEVKDNKRPEADYVERLAEEAAQLSAMALRFLIDVC